VAAVNAAQGTTIKYYPTQAFLGQSPTGCSAHDISVDTYHLCGAISLAGTGFGRLANNEVPIFAGALSGASYTLSCPATATRNVSVICTVSLPGGATWTGSLEPITLTAPGAGTFCYAGICGTGSLAIATPTSGTSFSVTWQPVAAGSSAVTPAAGAAAWIDAAPAAVAVSAPAHAPSSYVF
jgi:hypothetical protein